MVQPPPSSPDNPDNDQLPQQTGVQQDISNGSSNQGSMQGASAGHDANLVHGSGNRITQIQNFFLIPTKAKQTLPLSHGKASRFWHAHRQLWLSLLLIPVLSTAVFSVPQVYKTLGLRQSTCFDLARKNGKPIIAIANFTEIDEQASKDTSFEDSLQEMLLERKIDEYAVVCRLNQEVSNPDQAMEVGQSREVQASLVLWAHRGKVFFWGGIVVVDWKKRYFFPKTDSDKARNNLEFQTKTIPELVLVLTHLTLSQTQYSQEQIQVARDTLSNLLDSAESQELAKQNPKQWAKAYLFRGFLYEDPANPNFEKALQDYREALRWNSELYLARLKLGQAFQKLGQLNQAEQTYKQLSQCKNRSVAASALIELASIYHQQHDRATAEEAFEEAIKMSRITGLLERASAYLQWWNDPAKAVTDLEMALKEKPKDPQIYEFLGEAQLRSGQREAAKKTYQLVQCYLTEESRTSLIEDLEFLVEQKLANQEDVKAIVDSFNTTPLPPNRLC
jgi:Tfp pilus assembly protein PilF